MNGLTIEATNGRCPDCLRSQEVGKGSSHRCVNDDCGLVAPTSIFKSLGGHERRPELQSGQNRAWTLGGAVD